MNPPTAGGGRLPHDRKDVRAEKMYAAAHPALSRVVCFT